MKDRIRVAIIQPKPYPSFDDPRNIGHALQLIEKCDGERLDVLCLPEYFPFQGESELAAAARQLKTYVVAGLVEQEGDTRFNTATLFDRSGRLLGRQRKMCIGSLERLDLGISPGDGVFRAFTTDFGTIGMPVCIDFWGQTEASRQLAPQGVDIIFNICIFPLLRDHWKVGLMSRAFEQFVPIVGVNTADYNAALNGRRLHLHGGGSIVLQPPKLLDRQDFKKWIRSLESMEGWITSEIGELEQVQITEVDLSTSRRFRGDYKERFGLDR